LVQNKKLTFPLYYVNIAKPFGNEAIGW